MVCQFCNKTIERFWGDSMKQYKYYGAYNNFQRKEVTKNVL